MKTISGVQFPETYRESRNLFRAGLPAVQTVFPDAFLESKRIGPGSGYQVDWIQAGIDSARECLIISTGLHGIEGLFGSAFLDLFLKEFLPNLNPDSGLLLLHGINPWGMAQGRKVNSRNVDLNRNFALTEEDLSQNTNPDYQNLEVILTPQGPLGALIPAQIRFVWQILGAVIRSGTGPLRRAALLGQSANPKGFYYSGRDYQPETRLVIDLISNCFHSCSKVVHLDIHTGYGPKRQMVLVNSPYEKHSPEEFAARFQYPAVVAADGDDFYQINGDFLDWGYRWMEREPDAVYFGTAFEFGTMGNGFLAELISLWIMVAENRLYWHGARNNLVRRRIKNRFRELYYPRSSAWREKAVLDSRKALTGILTENGFLL